MVLAGPGSGKTSVIVERTAYMINEGKIPASSILVVTFSRAAATEMKERFLKFVGQNRSEVTFGTFHGIFYGILKAAYHLSAANILSEEEKFSILREMTEKYGQEMAQEGDFIEEVAREISVVKGNCISPEHYYASCCSDEIFRDIFHGYKQALKAKRKLDFDDMILCCYELFSQRQDILNAWRRKFVYILVDEFQDINSLQYKILQMLAAPVNNLFIVGDDDQSIYHFRGARPEIMLNFTKDYPKAETVLLKVAALKKRMERGEDLLNTAILLRTNQESEGLINVLMEYQVPFTMKEQLPNLFRHWICRALLAYLEMAAGDRSRKNLLEIMNRPNRYISREALNSSQINFNELREYYKDKDWMCDRITTLETHLRILGTLSPFAAINFIRKGMGFEEYLREYAQYRKIKPEELLETLDRIHESAKGMKTLAKWQAYIEEYTKRLNEQARKQQDKKEGVTISTLHAVKGLEYDIVYILNVNEGSIPYRKAVLAEAVEEERRLFYVGMTRAKKKLVLAYVKRQYEKEREPSRFLEETGL